MSTPELNELDVLIVGGGFAGLYQLHQLRELGFKVQVFEAGSDIGGVWHWNTYPGARVDTPAPLYQFSRAELWKDWDWTELYPSQEELVRYFQHVDTRLNLSTDIKFNTRVVQANFDETSRQWIVRSRDERTQEISTCHARFVTLCLGFGSQPYIPTLAGLDEFEGEWCHTARWPREGIDLAGRRVGVLGTGASGVQVIQECAPHVTQLTVFQRTPNLALPMRQRSLNEADNRALKATYPDRFATRATTFAGFDYDFLEAKAADLNDAELTRSLEKLWQDGGLKLWLGGFVDVLFSVKDNERVYRFWRDKVRAIIDDPAVADKLAPSKPPHPFGVKRCSLEQNYFETFNRSNVDLVDLVETPLVRVTAKGVLTADGREHPLDVLILATGFDAFTGGLTSIDLRGTAGQSFAEAFADGTRTALGKATSGFPNMFYVYGPQSPSAFCNGPTCAELEGDWVVNCLDYLRSHNVTRIEALTEAENEWHQHVSDLTEPSLFPYAKSWYMGANVPGKKRELLAYPGGLPLYLEKCHQSARNGYSGFALSPAVASATL